MTGIEEINTNINKLNLACGIVNNYFELEYFNAQLADFLEISLNDPKPVISLKSFLSVPAYEKFTTLYKDTKKLVEKREWQVFDSITNNCSLKRLLLSFNHRNPNLENA